MTDTTTEAVERLMNGVTPGPWTIEDGRYITARDVDFPNDQCDVACVYALRVLPVQKDSNATFIAASRDLVPALLAERDALKAQLAASQSPDPVTNADSCQQVTLKYTNWRGETADRTIIPRKIWFGSTEWHPEPQWLLTAIDVEKNADRDFALKDFGHPTRTYEDGVLDAAAVADSYSRQPPTGNHAHDAGWDNSATCILRVILDLIKEKSHE